MTIQIELPDDLAHGLTRLAESSGQSPEEIALGAIRRRVSPFADLDDLLAPTYAAMRAAGVTEDEAVEIFEAEKHTLRKEREGSGQ